MKKNCASMIPCTGLRKNEFTVYILLTTKNTKKLERMLKDGLLLSGYCLTLMDLFGMNKEQIRDMCSIAKRVQKDIFWWLKDQFELHEISSLLFKWKSRLPLRLLTDEEKAELGMFSILMKLQRYDILAKYAPKVLLRQVSRKTNKMFSSAKALLEYDFRKYADFIFQKEMFGSILSVKGGWKYLIDHGQKDFVLGNINNAYITNILPEEEIRTYCKFH